MLGDKPCSLNINTPPSFKTLLISCNVLWGSGIEHKAYVLTTVSTELLSTDKLLADSIKNSTFKLYFSARFCAIWFNSSEGSIPKILVTFWLS